MANEINIAAGFDSRGIKDGTKQAVEAIQSAGNAMKSATDAVQNKTEPAFKSLAQAYRQTAKDAQAIALAQGTSSAAFEEATSKAAAYRAQLEEVNAVISQKAFGDNAAQSLGKVTQGANQLNFAMAQITREAPAFTYSMQTGFMAISNNIPMLVDQINLLKRSNMELAASGQPTKSVLAQLGSAVLSWNTALSVGITALTVFGEKIFGFNDGTKQAAEEQKKLAKETQKANDEINNQVTLMYKRNEELKTQISAMQAGLSVDEFTLKTNEKRIQQIKAELKATDELASTQAANFLKGRKVATKDERYITMLRDELKLLEEQTIPLRRTVELKKELDDLARKQKEKEDKKEIANATKEQKKAENELNDAILQRIDAAQFLNEQNDKTRLTSKQGNKSLFGNVLGDLPEQLRAGQIEISNFVTATQAQTNTLTENVANSFAQLGEIVKSTSIQTFGQLGTIIGQSLAGVDTSLEQVLGNIADTIGNALLAIGAPLLAIPGSQGLGAAYMAGGFALKAVAGYLNATASKKPPVSRGNNSFSNGTISGGNFTPQIMNIGLTSRLLGNDLLLSVEKSNQKQSRVK